MTPDPLDAVRRELAGLRAAIALIATRTPDLTNDDGRILVDLLTPPAGGRDDGRDPWPDPLPGQRRRGDVG